MSDIKKIYFFTSDYNRLTNDILDVKIKSKKLVIESYICGLKKNYDLDEKIETFATKAKLKA